MSVCVGRWRALRSAWLISSCPRFLIRPFLRFLFLCAVFSCGDKRIRCDITSAGNGKGWSVHNVVSHLYDHVPCNKIIAFSASFSSSLPSSLTILSTCSLSRARRPSACPRHTPSTTTTPGLHGAQRPTSKTTSPHRPPPSLLDAQSSSTLNTSCHSRRRTTSTTPISLSLQSPSSTGAAHGLRHVRAFTHLCVANLLYSLVPLFRSNSSR